jgi:hypothetical protein
MSVGPSVRKPEKRESRADRTRISNPATQKRKVSRSQVDHRGSGFGPPFSSSRKSVGCLRNLFGKKSHHTSTRVGRRGERGRGCTHLKTRLLRRRIERDALVGETCELKEGVARERQSPKLVHTKSATKRRGGVRTNLHLPRRYFSKSVLFFCVSVTRCVFPEFVPSHAGEGNRALGVVPPAVSAATVYKRACRRGNGSRASFSRAREERLALRITFLVFFFNRLYVIFSEGADSSLSRPFPQPPGDVRRLQNFVEEMGRKK